MTQAIRTAVIELMEGAKSLAVPAANVFKFGVFDGQPVAAQQALAIDNRYTHRFDVQVSSARSHKATPLSTKANYRVEARQVTIRVFTHLRASSDEDERKTIRALVEQNCSSAIAALAYPGALESTNGGTPTGIVSGMLCGQDDGAAFPRWEEITEDWKRQLHISRILGVAIVNVPRPF